MSMMISGAPSSFPNIVSSQGLQMYEGLTQDFPSSLEAASSSGLETHSNSLLYSLSILKEKVHETQSVVSILVCPDQNHPAAESTTATAIARMGTLLQEIVCTASSMLFTSQQMALGSSTTTLATNNTNGLPESSGFSQHNFDSAENYVSTQVIGTGEERVQGCFYSDEALDWYEDQNGSDQMGRLGNLPQTLDQSNEEASQGLSPKNHEIIEPDATDLLAKYTHYCQVCGKGFKRDANLRMHMRAHGDEYKSSEALINPTKKEDRISASSAMKLERKYSCPQEGCRWNRNHPKFQPLKSMICTKNHYKRSHCPKMYVCKRCSAKQFSVVSDLRTHEKHCGADRRWRCSCGNTFSRKDKLVGHVALFVGHAPAVNSLMEMGKF